MMSWGVISYDCCAAGFIWDGVIHKMSDKQWDMMLQVRAEAQLGKSSVCQHFPAYETGIAQPQLISLGSCAIRAGTLYGAIQVDSGGGAVHARCWEA
jgi:hypothetical protein